MKTKTDMLNEVFNAKPEINYQDEIDDVKTIKITLPYNCRLFGSFDLKNKTGRIGVIFVNEKIQQSGISGILMSVYVSEAIKNNIEIISGYSTSSYALKSAAKLFGEHSLNIFKLGSTIKIPFRSALASPKENYHVEIDLRKAGF